jgi:hypothetical protein
MPHASETHFWGLERKFNIEYHVTSFCTRLEAALEGHQGGSFMLVFRIFRCIFQEACYLQLVKQAESLWSSDALFMIGPRPCFKRDWQILWKFNRRNVHQHTFISARSLHMGLSSTCIQPQLLKPKNSKCFRGDATGQCCLSWRCGKIERYSVDD